MVPTNATATPVRRYSAEVVSRQIVYQGVSYTPGQRILITGPDVDVLREAGVIGDIKRIAPALESACVTPPETAARPGVRKR